MKAFLYIKKHILVKCQKENEQSINIFFIIFRCFCLTRKENLLGILDYILQVLCTAARGCYITLRFASYMPEIEGFTVESSL